MQQLRYVMITVFHKIGVISMGWTGIRMDWHVKVENG
jgi:hypothetical protein